MSLIDLQKHIDQIMKERNNSAISDFEGYSPNEMHHILYYPFEPNSVIVLQKLADADFSLCPIHNQVKYYLNLVKSHGEIKLTAKGNLPTKIVHEIYTQGFLEEYQFTAGFSKLSKETDSLTVNLTRLLAEITGLTKKRNGKLSLTKSGEKMSLNNQALFDLIFKTMAQKFNWAYYDGFENEQIGQFGFGFSLILLSKYGAEKRLGRFYSDKYFTAFPHFLESDTTVSETVKQFAGFCYSARTFTRFLSYFGLVEIEEQVKDFERTNFIIKTELFDKLIKIQPHK